MPANGHRFPLLIYEHMLNRWWPATLTLGLVLVGLWWPVSRHPIGRVESWRWIGLLSIGALTLLITVFLFLIRKKAYVQPFGDHLRLITPFLRMNISYKRFRRTSVAEMHALFPVSKLSDWKKEMLGPLLSRTAVVIDLNGFPVSPAFLRFFLSPFFFKDKTPHLVILVRDWMSLSTEIESLRFGKGLTPQQKPKDNSILFGLPRR